MGNFQKFVFANTDHLIERSATWGYHYPLDVWGIGATFYHLITKSTLTSQDEDLQKHQLKEWKPIETSDLLLRVSCKILSSKFRNNLFFILKKTLTKDFIALYLKRVLRFVTKSKSFHNVFLSKKVVLYNSIYDFFCFFFFWKYLITSSSAEVFNRASFLATSLQLQGCLCIFC